MGDPDDDYSTDHSATYSQIDWDWVLKQNEYLLKNTAAGGSLSYLQIGGGLLFDGEGTPLEYWQAMLDAGATEGQLYVDVRSGFLSRGKILVTGSSDEEAFTFAIRQFSQKEIVFSAAADIL